MTELKRNQVVSLVKLFKLLFLLDIGTRNHSPDFTFLKLAADHIKERRYEAP